MTLSRPGPAPEVNASAATPVAKAWTALYSRSTINSWRGHVRGGAPVAFSRIRSVTARSPQSSTAPAGEAGAVRDG
ncbi:hypothetical protein N5079_16955 [Planotetraspora sp. A-T 1434]|uniref:hypothetical protein n=1 Tax=Planotetraspora sp. A-T 1434 TaxID=2979219 RepID=UPI0021BE56C6|nr:hypothetical protein [Planotetraspora sp. A-T 1434]MCT9931899.1 hypothetical protein [Planotetraspora sp. A-T 1434]